MKMHQHTFRYDRKYFKNNEVNCSRGDAQAGLDADREDEFSLVPSLR
jgi:hypothetical protein